jgi:hypothetical protein
MDKEKFDLIIMYYEIKRLRDEEHFSIQRIADHLGLNFRTAKRYLQMTQQEFENYLPTLGERPFALDPYRAYIVEYLNTYPDTSASQMHDKLKENKPGFPMLNPKTVYNYVMKVRSENNIPKVTKCERQYSAVPDLPMGQQAQVDFGQKRLRTSTGEWQTVYFFAMLLCFSRFKYIQFRDKPFTSRSAVEAHEKAFEHFHGIPSEIVYDQDAVFIHRENLGEYVLTDTFERYRGSRPFKVYFCRPADPESKGKVENVVKYVKYNFLHNRIYTDLETINTQAAAWLDRTGNAMIHNTTRKIPFEEWCTEQLYLLDWRPLFPLGVDKGYKVHKTNIIKYGGNIYSVPFGTYKNDQTTALVTESDNQLIIEDENGKTIATHAIPAGKGQNVINNNHRRDKSVKLSELREQVREFFSYSTDIDTFITKIERLYPRYVRDQLTVLLPCCEKHGKLLSEVTLQYCVKNNIFHANDFKTVIEREAAQNEKPKTPQPGIKPFGGSKTQMIANMEPEKSDISEYEKMFTQSTAYSHEPIHAAN